MFIPPRWALWISFVTLIIVGITAIINFLFLIFSLFYNIYPSPSIILGEIFGSLFLIYFIVYTPIIIIYQHLKKK